MGYLGWLRMPTEDWTKPTEKEKLRDERRRLEEDHQEQSDNPSERPPGEGTGQG